ncbi:related to PET191 protein, involved in assembly of cytochrome oxidase [Fusarium proliferatum ET1]|uniref:Related to PET191 protein, involved in assembly of cytochrome oxidase n=1 Tax=Fusarium proliferatum (strain ET1) TaxID=1227346 RepID=A0A1L7VPM6_FUSPR|nr:related to PET191 protein, involved in assembly of cytochrome oxidase [Fusarium proliferatum ET1]CZR42423.1 related to PET191 protein, involved in assembly of cytochrome oxidase [Fusarium proliferatum ET1]
MNPSQSPPSQASSHFQLEPIPAAILVDKEVKRRDAIALLGACKTGCRAIDEEVMLGGFERGSVVGISAEDEELGVQLGLQTLAHSLCEGTVTSGLLITPRPASVMLAGLRDAVKSELEAKQGTKDTIRVRLRQCLEKVMLSCVFDMDGLWEALADLDCEVVEEKDGAVQDQDQGATEIRPHDTTYEFDEIQDSQDDDDVAFSPIHQASQPLAEEPCNKTQQHPDVIVITHFSSLLTGLFLHREKSAAHAALQLLSSHLRDLSRNLPSKPLILLLNSTSAVSSGPALATAASPAKQSQVDPTLRSIFNPPPLTGYSARRTKPNFGLIFTQLLDFHLLCTKVPKTRQDAEGAVRQLPGDKIELVWVVEVLLDELGVWEGHTGARSGREQRWAAVKVEKGRIVQAIDEKEPEAKIPNISDVRVAGGFGGRRV